MAITKKLRFEVFKRDGFSCVYCGKMPPEVVLECDHIEPKAKGGNDDINNLITACFDCNRGKRDIPLNKIPNQLSENLEILKEKEDQISEYRKYIKKIERRINKDIEKINITFQLTYPDRVFNEKFINLTIKRFIKLLPLEEIIEAMEIGCSRFNDDPERAIRYFCGVCWKKIKKDDPKDQIVYWWKELSKEAKKGIGFYRENDLEGLKNCDINELKEYMVLALKERRSNYWDAFIELVMDDI